MHLSYWELKNWFTNVDFTVVGSGIVGLHAALRLREKFPESKILILEKGMLPQGASTKNAGFACFGSLSEIIDDLKFHTPDEVCTLIQKRRKGLEMLRSNLGDKAIGYRQYGGYELFPTQDILGFEECISKMEQINLMLKPFFAESVFSECPNTFQFEKIYSTLIFNPHEAQIDTGNMMQELLKKAIAANILILNRQEVSAFQEAGDQVEVELGDFSFKTRKLLFANNGFANLLTGTDVKPARAQVLITEPIPGLNIRGTFHMDKGYYYFRNFENRILLGGGRNLDIAGETTVEFEQTELIQNRLEQLLKEVILPGRQIKIDHRWSGIMGMGPQKNPIVKQLSENVFCGVRLGGMGVAIGSLVGTELADLV